MSCFFSAFFGVYRGRFAPKITVLLSEKTIGKKKPNGEKVNQTECGSLKVFPAR